MRLTPIALLALAACSSQPPAANTNNIVQSEETNITADASPAPLDKAPIAKDSEVRFRCMDGVRIVARFDPDKGTATLTRSGRTIRLKQERMASGIRYSDGGTVFQGKGDDMTFEASGQPPIACTAIRR